MTTQTNDKKRERAAKQMAADLLGATTKNPIILDIRQKRKPLFACLECGKKFYSAKAAEKASFGDNGCPGCGGSDIDIYIDRSANL